MNFKEVCALTIHLVDEGKAGNLIFRRLTPNCLGLWLYTAHSAVNHTRAIEHPHRTLYFNRKVYVTRCINNVNSMLGKILCHALPEACRSRRRNCDTAFLFLLHPIHCRRAIMDFANLVIDTRIEQNTLCSRSFPGINMRGNADIAITLDWSFSGHLITYLIYSEPP